MAFIRQEKPTKNRDLLILGLLVFNIMKTTLEVAQSTSRPPRIVGHIKKVDPSLLDDENPFLLSSQQFIKTNAF